LLNRPCKEFSFDSKKNKTSYNHYKRRNLLFVMNTFVTTFSYSVFEPYTKNTLLWAPNTLLSLSAKIFLSDCTYPKGQPGKPQYYFRKKNTQEEPCPLEYDEGYCTFIDMHNCHLTWSDAAQVKERITKRRR